MDTRRPRPPSTATRLLGGALLAAALVAGPGAAAAADTPATGRPEAPPAARNAAHAQDRRSSQEQEAERSNGRPHEQEAAADDVGARSLDHRSGFVGAVVAPNPGAKTFGLQVGPEGAATTLTVQLDAGTAFAGRDHDELEADGFFDRLADLGPAARATVVARERTDAGRLVAELVVLRADGESALAS